MEKFACIVPCALALRSKGVACDELCCVCDLHQETHDHILFHNVVAQAVWNNRCLKILAFVLNFGDDFRWDDVFLFSNDCGALTIFCYTLWIL